MDAWRCLKITSKDGDTFTYTLERVTGEPEVEIKTVEGRDGMLQVNAFYDDNLSGSNPTAAECRASVISQGGGDRVPSTPLLAWLVTRFGIAQAWKRVASRLPRVPSSIGLPSAGGLTP